MKTKLRKRVQFKSTAPSRTQQHLKDECDVNSILEKYRKTGHISHIQRQQGAYGDFTNYQDLKTNLDTVKEAFQLFDTLPAQVRKRFKNDPSDLIDFVQDPQNRHEAETLGLVQKVVVNQAQKNDDKTTKNEPQTQPTTTPPTQA